MTTQKARKQYTCRWCGNPIKVGELYVKDSQRYPYGKQHARPCSAMDAEWRKSLHGNPHADHGFRS